MQCWPRSKKVVGLTPGLRPLCGVESLIVCRCECEWKSLCVVLQWLRCLQPMTTEKDSIWLRWSWVQEAGIEDGPMVLGHLVIVTCISTITFHAYLYMYCPHKHSFEDLLSYIYLLHVYLKGWTNNVLCFYLLFYYLKRIIKNLCVTWLQLYPLCSRSWGGTRWFKSV